MMRPAKKKKSSQVSKIGPSSGESKAGRTRTKVRPRTSRSDSGRAGPIRFAVIGQGYFAQAAVLPAFARADGCELRALFSEDETKLRALKSGAPTETKSYVLIMEDPDSKKPPQPVIHWVAWNMSAQTTGLREGLQKQDRLEDPTGMRQGPSTSGQIGYRGPRPPAGDPPHHYHLQVFAIDRQLDLPPGADRDEVLAAAKGHVLASGELVGTFKRPDHPARP